MSTTRRRTHCCATSTATSPSEDCGRSSSELSNGSSTRPKTTVRRTPSTTGSDEHLTRRTLSSFCSRGLTAASPLRQYALPAGTSKQSSMH
ncbi:unnamed protein product [Symbiodinium sp. CCMP2456]|nr:unnamed protein product [Symbiodinium sp. CCMP2456]